MFRGKKGLPFDEFLLMFDGILRRTLKVSSAMLHFGGVDIKCIPVLN
jgi:hypothetical protein